MPGTVPGTGATAANCFLSRAAHQPPPVRLYQLRARIFVHLDWIGVGVGHQKTSQSPGENCLLGWQGTRARYLFCAGLQPSTIFSCPQDLVSAYKFTLCPGRCACVCFSLSRAPDWAAGVEWRVAEGNSRPCQAPPSTPTVDTLWASLVGGAAYGNGHPNRRLSWQLSLSVIRGGDLQEGQEAGGILRFESHPPAEMQAILRAHAPLPHHHHGDCST